MGASIYDSARILLNFTEAKEINTKKHEYYILNLQYGSSKSEELLTSTYRI